MVRVLNPRLLAWSTRTNAQTGQTNNRCPSTNISGTYQTPRILALQILDDSHVGLRAHESCSAQKQRGVLLDVGVEPVYLSPCCSQRTTATMVKAVHTLFLSLMLGITHATSLSVSQEISHVYLGLGTNKEGNC
jgi:hypothetical protein